MTNRDMSFEQNATIRFEEQSKRHFGFQNSYEKGVDPLSPSLSPPTSPVSVLSDPQEHYSKAYSSQRELFKPSTTKSSMISVQSPRTGSMASLEFCLLHAASKDDVFTLNRVIESRMCNLDSQCDWWCDDNVSQNFSSSESFYYKRTALMVAAMNSSLGAIMTLIRNGANINSRSIDDGFTALHCAALSKGSSKSKEMLWLLLQLNADPNIRDNLGRVAIDLYTSNLDVQHALKQWPDAAMKKSTSEIRENFPSHNSQCPNAETSEQKQTPRQQYHGEHDENESVSLSMLDLEEFSSDEFRMFHFKVLPCCRTEPHNWRECPFVHEGETAKRRDPRIFNYSATVCTEFRRGNW